MNENDRDFKSRKVSQGDKGPHGESENTGVNSQDQEVAVAALRESKERYEALFNRQIEAVYICDFEGNFIDANPAALHMLGYDKEEIQSLDFEALITPSQIPQAFEVLKEIIETGSQKDLKEYKIRHKDGHYIDIETKGSLIYRNGEPYEIQGTARDITERKKVEEQLTEQNRFLINVMESLAHPFYVVNAHDYRIESANSIASQMGIIEGQKCHDVTYKRKIPCHLEGKLCPLDEVKRTKGPVISEQIHKDSNGNPIHVEVHTYPIFNSEGDVDKAIEYTLDITGRKKVEEAIKNSEEKFRKFFENEPEYCYMISPEGIILDVNKSALKALGYEKDELIGSSLKMIYAPEYQKEMKALFKKWKETGSLKNEEMTISSKTGERRHVLLSTESILDESGNLRHSVSVQRDITEMKEVQEALQYRLAYEELLANISTHFINLKSEEIDTGINEALEKIGKFVGVDRSYIFLQHELNKISNTHEWCAKEIEPQKDDLQNLDKENFKWITDQINTGLLDIPRISDIPKKAGTEKEVLESGNIKSLISVPIVISGSIIGFLGFDSVKKERTWSKDTQQLIKMTAEIFANALERTRSEEVLRESEEKYRLLFENSLEGISVTKEDTIISANKALLDIYGYESFEEYAKVPLFDHLAPESKEIAIKRLKDREKGVLIPPYNEYRILRKDGQIRDIDVSTTDISIENEKYIQATIRDITERKKTEEMINESESKYRGIVEQSTYGVVIAQDYPPKLVFVNKAFAQNLGYTSEEILSFSPKETMGLVHLDDHEMFFDRFKDRLNGKEKVLRYEVRGIHKDHSVRWFDITSNRVIYKGDPAVQATFIDITERKKAEEALRESEKRFRNIMESIELVGVMLDIRGNITFCNDFLLHLTGWEREEVQGKNWFRTFLPPEIQDDIKESVFQKTIGNGEFPSHYENEIITKTGERRLIAWNNTVFRSPLGDVIGTTSIGEDITERKKAEEALRKSENRYRKISELISDFVYAIRVEPDGSQVPEWSTETLKRILGMDYGEILKEGGWQKVIYPEDLPIVAQRSQDLAAGKSDVSEYRVIAKDGEVHWVRDHGYPIWDEKEGHVVNIYGAAQDITERKKAEEALLESEEKYRLLAEDSPTGIFISNPEKFLYVNQRLCEITGYDKEELLSMKNPITALFTPEEHERMMDIAMNNFKGANPLPNVEARGLRKDKQEYTLKLTSSLIELGGQEVLQGNIEDITERKNTEEALRKSQKRLLTAQHIAHLGFWEWDLKTSELYWSDEAYRIMGYEPQEFKPTYDDYLKLIHHDDKDAFAEAVDNAMHGKSELNIDHRLVLSKGREIYVTSQGELIRDVKGIPIRMMGTMIDITTRMKAQREIKKRNEELYTLNTISGTINQTLELKEVLSEALEETISVLNVEGGLIYLAEKSKDTFSPAIYYGFSKEAMESISGFSIGEGISGQAAELGVPLFVPNLSEDAQHISSAFLQDGWDSLVSVPLNSKGEVVGVMTVSSREKNKFKPEDIGLLRSIGNQIGVAIENARLYGLSQDELAERRRAEKKVSQQNKFLKSVIESLTHPFYVVNVNNNLIEVANSAARTKGLTVGSICHDITESMDNIRETNGYFCPINDMLQTKEPKTVEHFFHDESGNMKYNEVHAYPIFDDKGDVDRVIEYAVDITDRKRAEAGLNERDAQLRSVITAAPIVLWSLDREGKFTLSEGKALADLGLKPGQVVGQSVFDVYRDAPKILDDNKRALKGEEFSSSLEFGDLVWETFFSPLKDQKGKVMGSIGVATDITKRRRAESEREILFRELKHRVKNNLQLLSSMVDMQILRTDNKAVRDKLQEIQGVIDTIALIYTRAYEGSKLMGLNLNNFIEEIITASMKFKADDELHISYTITGDKIKLNTDQALPMALIANELVFNALKHAFLGRNRGKITVSLKKVNGEFAMSIADDGVGMKPEIDLKKPDSFGLKIIKNLIEQLNGKIETVVDGGTEFIITIPIENGE
jgi:PAS domain S-box-containing protein